MARLNDQPQFEGKLLKKKIFIFFCKQRSVTVSSNTSELPDVKLVIINFDGSWRFFLYHFLTSNHTMADEANKERNNYVDINY